MTDVTESVRFHATDEEVFDVPYQFCVIMFYKFNSMLGRIASSTQAEAYNPQGLSPLTRGPSVIIFDSKQTKIAHEPAVKSRLATTAGTGSVPQVTSASLGEGLGVVPANPRYQKIMQMQNVFLKEDGKLVWQKLGGRDRVSYLATLGLMVVGTFFSINVLYKMSFPKSSEE